MKEIICKPVTIKEFNQYYQGLHDQLEKIFNYKPSQANLNIRDLAGIKLNALEKVKEDIAGVPENSPILLVGYQTSCAVGPITFKQIEDFISQNKID